MKWDLMHPQSERFERDRLKAAVPEVPRDVLDLLDEEARYYAGRELRFPVDERRWRAELESEA